MAFLKMWFTLFRRGEIILNEHHVHLQWRRWRQVPVFHKILLAYAAVACIGYAAGGNVTWCAICFVLFVGLLIQQWDLVKVDASDNTPV